MLSREPATGLSGRYIEFEIHALDYTEFLRFHRLEDSDESLSLYFSYGGMPHLSLLGLKNELVDEYLRNLYSTILLKDITARVGLRNILFLERLSSFVADNIGSLFSATSISKYLKSQKERIPTSSILNYLRAMQNAFIINRLPRFDIRGKSFFETQEKYYFEDIGLRNTLVGKNLARDIEKLKKMPFISICENSATNCLSEISEPRKLILLRKKEVNNSTSKFPISSPTRKRDNGNSEI